MSTKPVTLPRWSTDQTNMTPPSSGQMDSGWTPGQDGVSDYDNWAKFWTYKWIEWLNDGDISFKNLTVTAGTTFNASHAVTLTGGASLPPPVTSNLDVRGGGLNLTDVYEVRLSKTSSYAALGGIAGGVDGREILLTSTTSIYLKHEDASSTAANRISLTTPMSTSAHPWFPDMISMGKAVKLRYHGGSSRWIIIGHEYPYERRSVKTLWVPTSAAALMSSGVNTLSENMIILGATGSPTVHTVVYPISITTDSYTIISWRLYASKNTDSTNTGIKAQLFQSSSSGVASAPSGTLEQTEDGNAPGPVTLGQTSIQVASAQGRQHYIRVTPDGGVTPSADRLYHLEVDYIDSNN